MRIIAYIIFVLGTTIGACWLLLQVLAMLTGNSPQ